MANIWNERGNSACKIQLLNVFLNLGFDNRKIDQHLLTPWNNFEQGWAAYATYDEHLLRTVSGPEESNSYLTTEISHPKEVFVSALYYTRFAIDSDCRLEQQFMNTLGSFCALDD